MELQQSYLYTILTALSAGVFIFGFFFFLTWNRERIRKIRFEERKYHDERSDKLREIELESMRFQNEQELKSENDKNMKKQILDDIESNLGINSGGYIIIDMPSTMRSMFQDLLKGFEEYAKLRGYIVYFSLDNSLENKIGFKFTVANDGGVLVSTQTVRRDIKEYIEKIKNDDNLDNMPRVISEKEHNAILKTMKKRVKFFKDNYESEKTKRMIFERLLEKLTTSPYGILPQQSVVVQTGEGGKHNPNYYLAQNSQNLIQGNQNKYDDSSEHNIKISHSFNEKQKQIEKILELVKLFKNEEIDNKVRQEVITNLYRVKDEISEEEVPSKPRILRWLSRTKEALKGVVLAHHTEEAINWLFESFNFLKDTIS